MTPELRNALQKVLLVGRPQPLRLLSRVSLVKGLSVICKPRLMLLSGPMHCSGLKDLLLIAVESVIECNFELFEHIGAVILTALEGREDLVDAADGEELHDSFLLLCLGIDDLLWKLASLNDVTDSVVLVSLHLHHERSRRITTVRYYNLNHN